MPFGMCAGSAPFLLALQRAFCCRFYMVPIVSTLSLLSARMKGGPVGCLCLAFCSLYKPSSVIPVRIVCNIQEFLLKFMRIFIREKALDISDYVEMSKICVFDI